MRIKVACVLVLLVVAPGAMAQERLDGKTPAERAAALVRYVSTVKPEGNDATFPKQSAAAYAARLLLNIDTEYALKMLDESARVTLEKAQKQLQEKPDTLPVMEPFDKIALVHTYLLCKDKIPQATAEKIKAFVAMHKHRKWEGYGAMNYRLMKDGAGYMAAEIWPDLVDADGLNAEQIKSATRERLFEYFDGICKQNYHEAGSPIYAAVNLAATRMLVEFAHDPEMRKRATFALDAMMLDIACTWNQGYNVGPAGRAKYWGSTDTSPDAMSTTAASAWIWYGANRPIGGRGTGWVISFFMATPGTYIPPEIFIKIAQDRTAPIEHRWYLPGMGKDNVHRVTYHTPTHSLCSQWDQAPSPTSGLYKEARRNMLKWISPKPSSTFCVCMDNPRRPYNLKENIANAIGYGENPFSQYLQHQDAMVGIYSVPEDYPYYKLYAPFTRRGAIVKRIEKSGWVFCHNGSMLMAFYSVKPYTWADKPWDNNDMLWVDARKNGWILQTSQVAPFAGEKSDIDGELDRFAQAVIARTKIDSSRINDAIPRITFTTLSGQVIELTYMPHDAKYTNQCSINGKVVEYDKWPIYDNPFVHQDRDSLILTLNHGDDHLVYDFDHWTRQ